MEKSKQQPATKWVCINCWRELSKPKCGCNQPRVREVK
jgi:hypothetical protein